MALLMAAILLVPTSCASEKNTQEMPSKHVECPCDSISKSSFNASTEMAFSLFNTISSQSKQNENIMISPLSLNEILIMLANGATGNTQKQIRNVMGTGNQNPQKTSEIFSSLNEYLMSADDGSTVTIASSMWIDNKIKVKNDFIAKNQKYFDADTRNQALATLKTMNDINSWVENKTNGRIKRLISSTPSSDARMILVNTLYLNAKWEDEFDKGLTKEEDFTNSDGTKSKVMMMHDRKEKDAYVGDKMDMARFHYLDGKYCMEIYLPHEGEDLDECLKDFNKKKTDMMRRSQLEYMMNIGMPRMELNCEKNLIPSLKAMGITDAFSNAASFKGISDEKTYVSDILQKTYIKIDEEGTEASAATKAEIAFLSVAKEKEPTPLDFIINRPFAYIIRENESGTILFMGKVRHL